MLSTNSSTKSIHHLIVTNKRHLENMVLFDSSIQSIITEAHPFNGTDIWVLGKDNRNLGCFNPPTIGQDNPLPPVGSTPRFYILNDNDARIKELEREEIREQYKRAINQYENDLATANDILYDLSRLFDEISKDPQIFLQLTPSQETSPSFSQSNTVVSDREFVLPEWLVNLCSEKEDKHPDIRVTYKYGSNYIKGYINRYSPRTYAEGYYIIHNLLNNGYYKNRVLGKKQITLLDLGCGPGFATIGAIAAIIRNMTDVSEIEIEAYDYNPLMLDAFMKLIKHIQPLTAVKLIPHFHIGRIIVKDNPQKPNYEYSIQSFKEHLKDGPCFDFILCFKMINEIIYSENNNKVIPYISQNSQIYCDFTSALSSLLSETGVLVLLDIAKSNERDEKGTTMDESDYHALLSKGVNESIMKNTLYGIIAPVPCAKARGCINEYCSTQKRFGVSNINVDEDSVAYFIITHFEVASGAINCLEEGNRRTIIYYTKRGATLLCPAYSPPDESDKQYPPRLHRAGKDDKDGFDIATCYE